LASTIVSEVNSGHDSDTQLGSDLATVQAWNFGSSTIL
jgi:hypothetical protein